MKNQRSGVLKRLRNDMGLWLYGCIFAAAVAIFVLVWFAAQTHRLVKWDSGVRGLTSSFSSAYERGATLTRGAETVKADEPALDQFFALFIAGKTVPISKKVPEPNERTIELHLPDTTVSFTPIDGSYQIAVRWTKDGADYAFAVNSHVEFHNLDSYMNAASHRAIS